MKLDYRIFITYNKISIDKITDIWSKTFYSGKHIFGALFEGGGVCWLFDWFQNQF